MRRRGYTLMVRAANDDATEVGTTVDGGEGDEDSETTGANKPKGGGGSDPEPDPSTGLPKSTLDLLVLLVATGGVKGSLAVVLGYFVGINALAQVRRLRLRKPLVSHTFSEPSLPILSPPFVC